MTPADPTPNGTPPGCFVCDTAAAAPVHATADRCCPPCSKTFAWFRDRLRREGTLAAEHITLGSAFLDDLGIDSAAFVDLLMDVEQAFGVPLSDAEAVRLRTVADTVRYIARGRDAFVGAGGQAS